MIEHRRLALLVAAVGALLIQSTTPGRAQVAGGSDLGPLYRTGIYLGFAAVRAACSPLSAPLPRAAAALMQTDLANARQAAAMLGGCVNFPASRFDDVARAAQNPAVAAQTAWGQVDALYREFGAAVRVSACTLGLPSSSHLESFYVGSIFMGFATARAGCHYLNTAIPAGLADYIRRDLDSVRQGLTAGQSCLGPLAFLDMRIDAAQQRLGTVTGIDSFNELVAVSHAIEADLQNSPCRAGAVAVPPGGGGQPPGTRPPQQPQVPQPPQPPARPPRQIEPAGKPPGETCDGCAKRLCPACANTVVLLCEAMGNPECQACIDKNCRRQERQ